MYNRDVTYLLVVLVLFGGCGGAVLYKGCQVIDDHVDISVDFK